MMKLALELNMYSQLIFKLLKLQLYAKRTVLNNMTKVKHMHWHVKLTFVSVIGSQRNFSSLLYRPIFVFLQVSQDVEVLIILHDAKYRAGVKVFQNRFVVVSHSHVRATQIGNEEHRLTATST